MIKITSVYNKSFRIYWILAAIVAVGLIYFFFIRKEAKLETVAVHPSEFLQQVSVSGKVTATENIDLAFEQAGIVRSVPVKVGDTVKANQLLASQDVSQLSAQFAEMQAGIDLQKAKLGQSMADPSPEDLKIKEDAVATAQKDLDNTYEGAVAVLESSYDAIYNTSTLASYIQLTYFNNTGIEDGRVQDAKKIIDTNLADAKKYITNLSSQNSIDLAVTALSKDLASTYGALKAIREQCEQDIFYFTVLAADKSSLDAQRASVNTSASGLLTLKQSITSAKAGLQQSVNELNSLNAPLREADIAVYQAQIRQAEASAQNILAQIRKRQILAPMDGVITQVNAKVGATTTIGQGAISMISSGKFQIESYVPEIYISLVKVGNDADVTLDSYGADKIFKAKVISIDPSETIKDGVSTYKIKLELQDGNELVRDGMTANVIITTEKKDNTISVLQGVIITRDGKKFVKVLEGKNTVEKEVVVGDASSSGQVEIISGLSDGDLVIVK
jgi:HlyD family secretion protein